MLDLAPDFDFSRYLRVGEVTSARPFVEADIPDPHLASGWGHDGQANYVLSQVFPNLADAEGHLDSVTYRSRRIVYPALTAWLPDGQPTLIGMWVLNLIATGLAAAAIGALAVRHNASWIAGATGGLTLAFLASMVIDLGDALGLALAAGGLYFWRKDRGTAAAIVLFSPAALTRETTLLIPAAAFLAEGIGRRRFRLIPPAIIAAWIVVLDITIGDPGKSSAQFRRPFAGWVDQGIATPEILVASILGVASLWLGARLWNVDRTWALIVLFDLAVLIAVDRAVLFNTLNLTRVIPWVIPLAAIVLSRDRQAESADKDGLDGERHTMVEGLVDRTALRHA
jgi:hypothetical protein